MNKRLFMLNTCRQLIGTEDLDQESIRSAILFDLADTDHWALLDRQPIPEHRIKYRQALRDALKMDTITEDYLASILTILPEDER